MIFYICYSKQQYLCLNKSWKENMQLYDEIV